jgi:hypothetical protein
MIAAHNGNNPTITPFAIHVGNCPIASSAHACILQLFQAYHSESVFGQVSRYLPNLSITESPKHPFAHSKGSLQLDGLSNLIWRVLTLVSRTTFPSSISTMLGPEWFIKLYTKAYNTPSNGYSQVRQSLSILMWSRAHHSSKSLLILELRLPSVPP